MHESELHTTAILVFAHSPEEEMRHKKIAKGGILFDALTRHVLAVVEKTGLPYFHFSEEQQSGGTFGERFTNAIQYVLDQGYENVITIGNDTPQLESSHILKSVSLLHQNRLVLGPSADGGFYLMGLQKSDFNPSIFKQLPWQTSRLTNVLTVQAECSGNTVVQLERLHDIDTQADLAILLRFVQRLHHRIRMTLISLTTWSLKINQVILFSVKELYLSNYYNKGSPICQRG